MQRSIFVSAIPLSKFATIRRGGISKNVEDQRAYQRCSHEGRLAKSRRRFGQYLKLSRQIRNGITILSVEADVFALREHAR